MTLAGPIATSLATMLACGAPADDAVRAEILGVLTHARVTVDLDAVPVREALDRLASALGVNMIGRYDDDQFGHGLDPTVPITLQLESVSGRDALEMIIDQAALYSSCSWQMRTGSIEVGTKRRLGYATERQIYPIRSMLLEPPYFGLSGVDREHFNRHPYRSASLKIGDWQTRYSAHELMDELIRAIAEVVEPGNWDFALSSPPPTGLVKRTDGPYRSDENRVARIRTWRDGQLLVVAPDYFHRQIMGPGRTATPTAEHFESRARPRSGLAVVGIEAETRPPSVLAGLVNPKPKIDGTEPDAGPPLIRGSMIGAEFHDRAIAVLLGRRISLELDETPARAAIETLEHQLGVPVIGRYDDDSLGYGMDPDVPITLSLADIPGLSGLEAVLEEIGAFTGDECTWQIRRGYIEVGTKDRLSVPAARTLRLYYIRDLMLDIADYNELRKTPEGMALDRVDTIVNTIEPEAWDWGQIDYYEGDEGLIRKDAPRDRNERGANADRRAPRPRPEYVEPRKPAIVRHWRDVLIVHAPDYIHRQLGGMKPLESIDPTR